MSLKTLQALSFVWFSPKNKKNMENNRSFTLAKDVTWTLQSPTAHHYNVAQWQHTIMQIRTVEKVSFTSSFCYTYFSCLPPTHRHSASVSLSFSFPVTGWFHQGPAGELNRQQKVKADRQSNFVPVLLLLMRGADRALATLQSRRLVQKEHCVVTTVYAGYTRFWGMPSAQTEHTDEETKTGGIFFFLKKKFPNRWTSICQP